MEDIKLTLRYLGEIGVWVVVVGAVVLVGLSIWSSIGMLQTKPWIVQSGSMEPTIMTGDVILAVPQNNYFTNQIVTFRGEDGRVTTHRIINNRGSQSNPIFVTKGDANRTEDADQIKPEQIIGKVVFTLPKMGYVIAYTRTPTGFLLMVVVPATIVISDEIRKMARQRKAGA